jgi:glycosyltransferase involved in cell wall biosynthesis
MSTYNRKHCIKKAIDSLFIQTYQNFELIIIDDGSIDKTEEYIKDIYKKEIEKGKIKYVKLSENKGASFARNEGLKITKGDWIGYLDTDNEMFPEFLKTYYFNIKNNPEIKIFYAQIKHRNSGKIIGREFNFNELLKGNFIDMGVFVHSIELYKEFGGFDADIKRVNDWDLIIKYIEKYKPIFIEKVLLDYYDGDEFERITNKGSYYDDYKKVILNYLNRLDSDSFFNRNNNFYIKDESINQKNIEIIELNDVIKQKNQEIQTKDGELKSKILEIEWMKSSKFWKIKTFYEKFKNPIVKIFKLFKKALVILKRDGLFILIKKIVQFIKMKIINKKYPILSFNSEEVAISLFNKQQKEFLKNDIKLEISHFFKKPLISIIMPVYNTNPKWLILAINSVINQFYENWELCIVDDCSSHEEVKKILKNYLLIDSRIKCHFSEKNEGISVSSNISLKISTGEYIAFLDHDDELTKDALFWVVKEINNNPNVDFIYSDECKIDDTEDKKMFNFLFKPDWDPEMLLNCMYTGHLTVYKKNIIDNLGGFRSKYDFSQDYDLALRVSEKTENIFHIERILYLWRAIDGSSAKGAKNFARKTNLAALEDAIKRRGVKSEIIACKHANRVKILFKKNIKISIVIPSDSYENLVKSIDSIFLKTFYENFELVIVTNSELIRNLSTIYSNLKNLLFSPYDKKYNFSDKCNKGANDANGEIIIFLNDDVYPIYNDWLENLVEYLFYDNKIGGVSPKLLWEDDTIQYAGMTTNVIPFCATFLDRKNKDEYLANVIRNTSILSGACLAIRKEVFLDIGGFDSINTPAGHSDLDLSFKLRESGYRCIYTPYSTLYHVGNHSWHIEKDKADIFVMSKWGKYISNDPYYTKSMRAIMEGYFPDQFGIFSQQKEFKKCSYDALIIIHELTITGAPMIAINMARVIKDNGGYPVIFSYVDGPLREEIEKLNIPIIINNFATSNNFTFKNFAKNFDIIISNTVVTYSSVFLMQDIVPTIWMIHEAQNIKSFFIPYFDLMSPSLLDVLKSTKALVCVASEYSFNSVKKFCNTKIKLINYGLVDCYDSKKTKKTKKIEFSIVGTVEERKSQDIFIEAILQLPEIYRQKAVFNIIGNGAYYNIFVNKLKQKTKNISSIIWHGLIIDQDIKLELFNNTSVFVVVSRDEPTSMVVIEGAMLGKPSIISVNVGAKYLVEEGKSGFIIDTGNVEQLKKIIMKIIDDPKILIPMGEVARKKYLETSTFDIFSKKLISLINEKLNMKK